MRICWRVYHSYVRREFLGDHCAKKPSNHHANLSLEMYSFTLQPPGKHLETTGADDPTL